MDVNKMMGNWAYRLITLKRRLIMNVLKLVGLKRDLSVLKRSQKTICGGLGNV